MKTKRDDIMHRFNLCAEDPRLEPSTWTRRELAVVQRVILELGAKLSSTEYQEALESVDVWLANMDELERWS